MNQYDDDDDDDNDDNNEEEGVEIEICDADEDADDNFDDVENYEDDELYGNESYEEDYDDDIEQQAGTNRTGHRRIPEVQAIPERSKSLSVLTEMTNLTPLMENDEDEDEGEDDLLDDNFDTVQEPSSVSSKPSLQPPPSPPQILYRPARISVTLYKESQQTRLGISFQSTRQGKLVVSNIRSDGLLLISLSLSSEPCDGGVIRPGDYLLTINDCYCARWSPSQATRHLQLLTGRVTLVVAAASASSASPLSLSLSSTNGKASDKKNENKKDDKIGRTTKTTIDPHSIQATVVLNNPSTDPKKWGLSFISEHGRLRVKKLAELGLLGDSALRNGDYIRSINGISYLEASTQETSVLLRSFYGVNDIVVTIRAISPTAGTITTGESGACPLLSLSKSSSPSSSLLYKLPPTTRVLSTRHVVLRPSSSRHLIVNDNSFSNFPRNEGQTQRSSAIDENNSFLAMAKAVSFRLGWISTTSNPWDPPNDDIVPKYYSAMIIKPTVEAKLGIHFKLDNQGRIFISHIVPGSIVATSTSLRTGLILLSINKQPVHFHQPNNKTAKIDKEHLVKYAYRLLQQAHQGEVVLVAQDPSPKAYTSQYVHASITKLDPRAPLDIVFASSRGSLNIKYIRPTGVFAASLLNHNDTVVLINEVPCRHWTSSEAVQLVRNETIDIVSIVARSSPSWGAVVSQWDEDENGNGSGGDSSGDPDAIQWLHGVADGLAATPTTITTAAAATTSSSRTPEPVLVLGLGLGNQDGCLACLPFVCCFGWFGLILTMISLVG